MDTTTEVNTFEEIYMTNPMEGKKSIKEANLPRHLSSPLGQKNPKEKEVTISDNQLHDALNLLQGLHLLGKTQPES